MRWQRSAVALAVFAALLAYVVRNLVFTTDISEFMPAGEDAEVARLSQAIARSELSRTLIVSLQARDSVQAVQASRLFEKSLRADNGWQQDLSFVDGGPPQDVESSLWSLYQPRRLAFAARNVVEAEELVSSAGLQRAVERLLRQLRSPMSTFIGRAAPEDPFLSVPSLLQRMQSGARQLNVVEGRYVAAGRYGIVLLGARQSAFDASAQSKVLKRVVAAGRVVSQRFPEVHLESSGLAKFAVSAERSIQADISRISLLSASALLILCLLLFRSIRLVVLTLIPVAFGMLAGMAALLVWQGKIHGLTLAFGASLIGVCVDYVIHFYVHHLHHQGTREAGSTMREIWPGLALGAGTTVVGFLVLAGSTFPGLGQAAIFGAVGVTSALVVTRWLLPSLMPRTSPEVRLRRQLGRGLERFVQKIAARRRLVVLLGGIALLVTLWGAMTVRWDDNMAGLTSFDPELRLENERVRQRVAHFDQSRFVIAVGETDELALQVNEDLAEALHRAKEAGELGDFQGVGELLPSARTQLAVQRKLRAAELDKRLPPILQLAGFDVQALAPFFSHLEEPAPSPLSLVEFEASGAAPLVRSFHLSIDGKTGLLTFLQGVQNVDALSARVASISGAVWIDQSRLMQEANESYRRRVVWLLAIGLLAVLCVLSARYRSLRLSLSAFFPSVLAAGVTVAVLSASGVALNLLSLTALLMVLSIGVDYGVFLTESRFELLENSKDDRCERASLAATLTGLLVACLSTVFGFGVLALSMHPALRTIGLVAAVGVTTSWLLAPLALAFSPRGPRRA